jgi:hypothetical protein
MNDKNEISGFWHFDSNIENSYSGTLIESNDEISIKLLGCTDVPNEPFIVNGTTTSGKKISLYLCHTSKREMSFPGIPSVEISAIYCFKGEHLTAEKISFQSSIIQISSLNQWVNIGGFSNLINDDETFSINYKNPEPITFFENENVEFSLLFYRKNPLFGVKHSCTITQDTLILIKHKTSFNLEEFWVYISAIKSFLTLAYFSEPQIQEIKFKQNDNTIILNYVGQKSEIVKEKTHRVNFLFTYKTIEDDFKIIFKKWYELNDIIEPVVNVLQECFGNRNIIIENKFLNLMQGIETFHRRRRQNEKEPKESYKKKISEIMNSCPTDFQDWLKERLSYSNEPTLQFRLENLFKELDISLKEHLFSNHETLIQQSKISRNYYTHYGTELENKALKGTELFKLTERLKIFLLILLLKETDINDDKVNVIVTNASNYLFNHLIYRS